MKVPQRVYQLAIWCWMKKATHDEEDVCRMWAYHHWPDDTLPYRQETLGLWIISIAYQDGIENE